MSNRFKDEVTNHDRLVNSMSKFLKPCHCGDKADVIRQLKQQKLVIHQQDCMKNNCLYWTIVSGNLNLFQLLARPILQGAEYENVNE
jgi:ankyrin repeat protein